LQKTFDVLQTVSISCLEHDRVQRPGVEQPINLTKRWTRLSIASDRNDTPLCSGV